MKLSEIAEWVIEKYPDSCISCNNVVINGCREEWYEESLVDELMDFFSYEIVGMCGCGVPEDTHEVIRRVLHIRKDWEDKKIAYESVQERYYNDLNLDTASALDYGMLQFILYMLDSKDILEHGSGIGGCWLTKLGDMYLTVLDAWYEQDSKNEENS